MHSIKIGTLILASAMLCGLAAHGMEQAKLSGDARAERVDALFSRDNLVAWCIVPFDGKRRGPEERADMLNKLNIKQLAYDWRAEHIPTFDAEIEALKEHDIALKSFWVNPGVLNEHSRLILDVLDRNDVETELWVLIGEPAGSTTQEKAKNGAELLRPLAEAADAVGCRLALYNHGGWFGEPENQVAIIKELGMSNVGIVYNLHHAHAHLDRLPELLQIMKPHLYCLNLNGMVRDGEAKGQKIVPLGHGELDEQVLNQIVDSGYTGPIGILGHTDDDVEERLLDNLEGLEWLVQRMKGNAAGERPVARTYSRR